MKNIWQIFITSDDSEPPEYIKNLINSNRAFYPEYNYKLLKNSEIRNILEENDKKLLWCYDQVRPYAYKADIARYMILYLYGGWYFDATVKIINKIKIAENVDFLVFRDAPAPDHHVWEASNSILYSKPKSLVMLECLNIIKENCETRYYGKNPLEPTGPSVLGKALAKVGTKITTVTGEYFSLTPLHSNKNYGFVLPNGLIFAFGKITHGTSLGGGISHFGVTTGNNYVDLWNKKEVYYN